MGRHAQTYPQLMWTRLQDCCVRAEAAPGRAAPGAVSGVASGARRAPWKGALEAGMHLNYDDGLGVALTFTGFEPGRIDSAATPT